MTYAQCIALPVAALETLRPAVLVGVVLVSAVVVNVLLVVHLLGVLLGLALGLLAVDEVGALGLSETVDLTAGEAGEELLCEAVGNGLACRVVSDCWLGLRE